ncbi:hypothetical protein LuPra_01136 [Luteitalea pratensis]|uniref:Uncharacterized protein n=1 Tax=Luteitalea pratensis TaxID=1855912 RepID=A0A143PHF4_LUTPR|nr:hypothetical protein [Luteitalea pratensis]AMY07951.1 hypothetical protein LuPra_01136 [Luteitalea pratensis]
MRQVVLSFCVLAAACSGQHLDSPTAPTSATAAPSGSSSQTQAQHGTGLPFRGVFTGRGGGVFNCPPTCPPTSFTSRGTYQGTATHLGAFTAAFVDVVDIATATSTGTSDFTAANGDRLSTTTAGGQDGFTPPNISSVRVLATITGGTGRFSGATGTLTVRFIQEIDYANGTGEVVSGSLDGVINLNE